MQKRVERLVVIVCLIGLLLALWPYAGSLYGLTGEEATLAQLRGVMHWMNTAVRPQPHLAPNAEINYADVSAYGVNTFLEQEAEIVKREESLRLAKAAGFDFIRQEFVWEDIENQAKGDFIDRRNDPNGVDAWAKYDNIVELAAQNDIQIVARLSNPPAWSRALPIEQTGDKAPPDDYDDFGDFAATVAERYRGRIRYYQIWNEPNGNEEWGIHQDVNAEAFTELLCLAYARIKAADPEAVVLAGALTPTVEISGRSLNDLIFLQRMYAAGAGDCFDIMSAQGYGLWSGPTDQRLRPTVINYPHNLLIRDVMVRHGDAEKPIWISEMAWNAVPEELPALYLNTVLVTDPAAGWNAVPEELPALYGRVTEEQQGRYGVQAYERAQQQWPWVGVMSYWFLKRPHDFESDQAWYYFRLMEPDFTPLPAYEALVAANANPAEIEPWPLWVYGWMRIRPLLFSVSAAGLLFVLLRGWMPEESDE